MHSLIGDNRRESQQCSWKCSMTIQKNYHGMKCIYVQPQTHNFVSQTHTFVFIEDTEKYKPFSGNESISKFNVLNLGPSKTG